MLTCDSLLSAGIGLYLLISGLQGLRQGSFSFRTRDIFSRQRLLVEGRLARVLGWVFILTGLLNLGALVVSLANPEKIMSVFPVVVLTCFIAGIAQMICTGLQQVHNAARKLHTLRTGQDT